MFTCLGDYAALIALYEGAPEEEFGSESRQYRLGLAHLAAGAPERARPYLDAAVVEGLNERDPHDLVHAAVALELLGRRTEALRAADAAIPLLPKRDAVNNPYIEITRAWVLIRSGERAEEGYAELKRHLGQFDLQPRWVAVSLPWVFLRDDARVQQIIRDALPK
jgi:tetratricopeptide (TPR) repeat protein